MVSGPRAETETSDILPAKVQRTIQSIKEIVGNHSDEYIYVTLKESNMDPNETAQKLLNQDPFHEVKRKRDKKKESTLHKSPPEIRRRPEPTGQVVRTHMVWDQNARRGGYARNKLPAAGISREFRVVRDNRFNQNANRDSKLSFQSQSASSKYVTSDPQSSSGNLTDQKHSDSNGNPGAQVRSKGSGSGRNSLHGYARNAESNGNQRSILSGGIHATVSNLPSHSQAKPVLNSEGYSPSSTNNSVTGVYSSTSDPVHVPSPDSRSTGNIGAIKREVGIVGPRRQSEHLVSLSSISSSAFSIGSTSASSFGHTGSSLKNDHFTQSSIQEAVTSSVSVSRSFASNQYGSKSHQPVSHQKAAMTNMEWKPKPTNQKLGISNPKATGTGTTTTSAPSLASTPHSSKEEPAATGLHDNFSQMAIKETQHVIIPHHFRVPEADRTRLTFGSFGVDFDSRTAFQAPRNSEESKDEAAPSHASLGAVALSEAVTNDQLTLVEDRTGITEADTQASVPTSEGLQSEDKQVGAQNLQSYGNIGLVHDHSPSYRTEEIDQQDTPPLPSFEQAYDQSTSYDMQFFRQAMDESTRGQGIASPSEALNSHVNSNPPTTVAMVQQQPVAPLYAQPPGVHIPHYTNFVPYRQYLSPLYVPPMAMPAGFSTNPAYPHAPSGSSYLLMPGGGSSHLTTGGAMKYSPSQYKPVPSPIPTAYGNYANQAGGYGASTPVVTAGLEDMSRIKYKESNLYIPNPQADGSEIWIQTPREMGSMQSGPFYNLSGGQAPHAAYVPSHTGHAPFNAAQSAHPAFAGLYHAPQPSAMANPHLVHQQLPSMGGNVGPTAQAPAYQPPQLGHINWNSF
ncbi:uncharacterized protein LOC18439379 isoform X1 [Amborella trichopoda]|uniref:uncharacterized protein LOC18439379 isoform X1 n=1 Tax=Amborella trichopoda TaxID=13333 RepID=UPI0005D3895B|nr:uncharacterized protein LOC18439379 isoform X1 [Amborella trichopoda]|eukprot:XP_011625290.1 uncharacterized protein LOC18439379 isoform X1 [Amborella trichopoda]